MKLKTHGNHHGWWYGIIIDPDEKCMKISWGRSLPSDRR